MTEPTPRRPPGRVLVLNAGSSTLKWAVLESAGERRVGGGEVFWQGRDAAARAEQVRQTLGDLAGIDAAGHRVVHGGASFREAVRITPEVRQGIAALCEIDPLHTPAALAGIDAVSAAAPGLPQVAAFDTAFHATLPDSAAHYPLPWDWTERWRLRRYGFHGLSVAYAVRRAAELLGEHPRRLIVCHLGSGCSVTAVEDGRSVDTTMGFTPLDGVMMATRPGALDPGLLLYLTRHGGLDLDGLEEGLSHRSGLTGVSGISGDLREVLAAAARGDQRADLAYRMFEHSLRHAVGAMAAVLGGVDAVVFTGGMGEHSARLRAGVAAGLVFAGVEVDREANERAAGGTARGGAGEAAGGGEELGAEGGREPGAEALSPADLDLATPRSAVRVLRIVAREDLAVLGEVRRVLGFGSSG
jgi:acetate kinase